MKQCSKVVFDCFFNIGAKMRSITDPKFKTYGKERNIEINFASVVGYLADTQKVTHL